MELNKGNTLQAAGIWLYVYIGEESIRAKARRNEDVFSHKRFLAYADLYDSIQFSLDVKAKAAKSYTKLIQKRRSFRKIALFNISSLPVFIKI